MKLVSILLTLIFTLSALAEETQPTIEASSVYRTTVSSAKSLVVFEGLPHQTWDSELLATELKRKDIKKIWDYSFYTPSVDAKNADDLRKLLSSAASIAVRSGGVKLCGGYHPDYSISWQADEVTYYALICFGCDEIVFYDGKTSLIYDLKGATSKRYQELLAVYEAKRPKRQ